MIVINATTPEEIANEFAKAVKAHKWHTFQGTINNKIVAMKVYRNWIQVFSIDGVDYAHPEFKTQKAMKAYIISSIVPAVKAAEDIKAYCMRGNGIYNWTTGGRWFDARTSVTGALECFNGDEWQSVPVESDWRGPNGERVYIHGRASLYPDSASRGNGVV